MTYWLYVSSFDYLSALCFSLSLPLCRALCVCPSVCLSVSFSGSVNTSFCFRLCTCIFVRHRPCLSVYSSLCLCLSSCYSYPSVCLFQSIYYYYIGPLLLHCNFATVRNLAVPVRRLINGGGGRRQRPCQPIRRR